MEIIFLFVSAVSNAMSAWAGTLTLWGYGPKPATPTASQTPPISETSRVPDMPITPGVYSPGMVINAEHIIINGPVFITNSPNADETQPIRDANPDDEDPAPKASR
ncbi:MULTISPECIES: hypothetical protein [Actinotignum]|uniref:hypothetical protein n=1 Tax=Actinotignum TaxID=1653174 RepID=UPI00237DA77B|nr:hypothetical protein [Actinotignum sanguinis]MDE1565778.1 hypothetical protein [Actinotignum sanguinis]MDK7197510.1 hypothetical protein [Actinotignum sanguinis]